MITHILLILGEVAFYLYFSIITYEVLDYGYLTNIILIVVMIIATNIVATIVHESGHLIGGCLSKHKFFSVQIGWIAAIKTQGKWSVCFLKWQSQCIMIPDKKAPSYSLYQMGGILFNFLFASVASYIAYYYISHGSVAFFFVCAFITACICKIACNGIPVYMHGYPINDMAFEKVLEKNRITREEYYLYLWCVEAVASGEDIRDVKRPYMVQNKGYCDLFWRKIEEMQKKNV